MSNPLISVLMPVHAFTPFTTAAVSSVLAQSHCNLELVIVGKEDIDDLLAKLPKDNRIRGFAREAPGVIGASNTGLKQCTGEYIARMDSDDLCHPDRLTVQLEFAQSLDKLTLIGSRVEIFSDEHVIGDGNRRYEQWLNSLTMPEEIKLASFIELALPNPSLFAHKDFWTKMHGYRERGWPEDYDLILRTWLAGIPMAKPEGTLLRWREHPNRLTRTDQRYSRQAFIQAKAWALTQKAAKLGLHAGRRVWICGTGRNARYWHDALIENDVTVAGFVELDSAKEKRQKRHLPVITYTQLEQQRTNELIVTAVSNPSARTALYSWCMERDYINGVDFIMGG